MDVRTIRAASLHHRKTCTRNHYEYKDTFHNLSCCLIVSILDKQIILVFDYNQELLQILSLFSWTLTTVLTVCYKWMIIVEDCTSNVSSSYFNCCIGIVEIQPEKLQQDFVIT